MIEKFVTSRVKQKTATLAEWQTVWNTFIPYKGEQCVFIIPANSSEAEKLGFAKLDSIRHVSKTGDGSTVLQNLPWDGDIVNLASYIAKNSEEIVKLSAAVDELMYKPVTISSLSLSLTSSGTGGTFTKSPVELGTTVTSVTLTWATNKESLQTATIDGVSVDTSKTSHTFSGLDLKSTKTYTLAVSDGKTSASKSSTITFCNRIYSGAAANPTTVNSTFVTGLATKSLSTSRTNNGVNYTASENQYLWYCVPTRLGECSFIDVETGLGAGLSLVSTIDVTNGSGYTEPYYVYRSDYSGLGSLTVKVT